MLTALMMAGAVIYGAGLMVLSVPTFVGVCYGLNPMFGVLFLLTWPVSLPIALIWGK